MARHLRGFTGVRLPRTSDKRAKGLFPVLILNTEALKYHQSLKNAG